MAQQETFLDELIDGKRVLVLKTYDESFAREAFGVMSDEAKAFLWRSMKPEETYDPAGLPKESGEEYDSFLLDELLEQGREDWNTHSYFVVTNETEEAVFVSSDWPTAEAFARGTPAPEFSSRPMERLDVSGPNF